MDRKIKISHRFGQQKVTYHKTALLQKEIALKLAQFLPTLQQASILEIGCGTGFLTNLLISHYPDSHLKISDLSVEMLDFTKKNCLHHKDIIFEKLDGEMLPKRYLHKFDLIVTSMTIQWFSEPLYSLEKLVSCLKPDGLLLYATLGADNFPEWRETLKTLSLSSGLLQYTSLPGEILSEKKNVQHSSALEFLKILKQQGAQTAHPSHQPLKTSQLLKVMRQMDKHHSSHTWHIIYGKIPSNHYL